MSENANINDNLNEIKAEMVKDNKRDAVKDNIRNIALVVMAVCAVIITVYVVALIYNINNKINAIYVKADTAVTALNQVASDVQEADLAGMADQLKVLTEDATNAVGRAMDNSSTVSAISSIFG